MIQPQNLFRNRLPHWVDFNQLAEMIANEEHHDIEIIYEDLMNTLASATRSMISAPEGKELIATDFSQIEARIVFTLAREFEALKLMADPKEDIYCDMAGDIYHHEVNKMDDPDERFVGKQSILGLGYGMGHLKFFNTMRDQFDVFLELEFCKTVVKIYRKKYRKVQKLWGQLQKAAFEAVENPGRKVYACSNLVHFKMHKRWLYVYLPSGRRISYVEPKIKMVFKWGREIPQLTYMGFDSFTRKWRRLETHGAKLLENISQAIVADICDEAGQRVQKKGYDVLFFVHDEIIAEIDKGQGSIKEFERIVSKQISWLPKLPVAVDGGWIGKRYRKT